jgi:hypothetical protein
MPRYHIPDRFLMLSMPIALIAAPGIAMAEVCDKVVSEQWRPADGPARTVVSGDWISVSPVFALLLLAIPVALISMPIALKAFHAGERASFMAAVYLKWTAYAAAILVALSAVFLLRDVNDTDDILRAAAREGCVSLRESWTLFGATALVVLLYGWTAWRTRRFASAAETRFRGLVPL